jgi:cytochrome P450
VYTNTKTQGTFDSGHVKYPRSVYKYTSGTIISELIDSKLPVAEKTFERVFADAVTVAGASFETPGYALRLIFYYVSSNKDIFKTLRAKIS